MIDGVFDDPGLKESRGLVRLGATPPLLGNSLHTKAQCTR